MTTHFISAEIDLRENPLQIQRSIETELAKHGQPLRWAITEVKDKIKVEAIILIDEAKPSSV